MKAFCLFEQSGTFKNAFRKYGVEAEDYDILNDFGQTDHVVDIFSEIEGGGTKENQAYLIRLERMISAWRFSLVQGSKHKSR